jgi:hypothetical protein
MSARDTPDARRVDLDARRVTAEDSDPLDLDALGRLHKAATPPPWDFSGSELERFAAVGDYSRTGIIKGDTEGCPHFEADRALVPATRNALPRLLAAAREHDAMVKRLAELVAKWRKRAEVHNEFGEDPEMALCESIAKELSCILEGGADAAE